MGVLAWLVFQVGILNDGYISLNPFQRSFHNVTSPPNRVHVSGKCRLGALGIARQAAKNTGSVILLGIVDKDN